MYAEFESSNRFEKSLFLAEKWATEIGPNYTDNALSWVQFGTNIPIFHGLKRTDNDVWYIKVMSFYNAESNSEVRFWKSLIVFEKWAFFPRFLYLKIFQAHDKNKTCIIDSGRCLSYWILVNNRRWIRICKQIGKMSFTCWDMCICLGTKFHWWRIKLGTIKKAHSDFSQAETDR